MVNSLLLSLATLASAYASVIPEISGYSRVSSNGASSASEPRNLNLSPVYHPAKHLKVYDGEVVDYSHKYSTLDKEMVAKLDGKKRQKQAEDRFVPSAVKLQSPSGSPGSSSSLASQSSVSGSSPSISSGGYATLPQSYSSNTYQFPDDDKVPKNNNNNNKFKIANSNGNNNDHDNLPSITDDGFSMAGDSYSKIPDSYKLQPDKIKNYPSYLDKFPSKPSYQPAPSYIDPNDPYLPNDNDNDNDNDNNNNDNHNDDEDHRSHGNFPDLTYPHEYIYDHPPDDYYHHHLPTTTTTTEEPINDQRLNKRPYSYYYIGKKLWYLPLYFSIYFIIYIAALVLKSVARHKINFPANLAEAAQGARHLHYNNNNNNYNYTSDLTQRVLER
ncbi:uncharacterized protein DDB_G0283357-like [Cotesia glomerata]|uniref:uncharacterized protein DDB_G0283357-like n=1 Tax=Cotesia glomerata TaxID=32391 RepID=UPI001D002C98|nr:uncharacterized protein DDB_G0283357-like [Cotesia glomerata]